MEFNSLFDDLAEGEDLVDSGLAGHETCLFFASVASDSWKGSVEQDAGKEFSWDGQKCYPSVVATFQEISFVLPEWKYNASPPVSQVASLQPRHS